MKTKQKRIKIKVILSIILPVLLITGMLAVSGHAEKPESPPGQSKKEPPPEPIWISVCGAIEGEGVPYEISVAFWDSSFGYEVGSFVVANPDYPPALKVSGPGMHKRLSYYYCDHVIHTHSDGICTNPGGSHDPEYYKSLTIWDGRKVKKTDQVLFPVGSRWRIMQKTVLPSGDIVGELVAEGYLADDITYEVIDWGTP